MSNERIAALEAAFLALESKLESRSAGRDQQLGVLATEAASIKAGLAAISGRVELVEIASRPASIASIWGPSAAALGLVITIGGSFLTMMQREQAARVEVARAQLDAVIGQQQALDTRLTSQLVELSRFNDRQFVSIQRVSTNEARQLMLEKQVEAMDFRGSRKWVKD